ncbi:MAG: hypothetical protein AAGI48_02130 [Verrucomicrobiota bacterium]
MNWFRLAMLACLIALPGCGFFGDDVEEPEATAPTAPRLVGRIASVNEAQRFVLVEGFGEWRLGEGLLLSSVGPASERTASLIASGERMGRFAAADWKSGDVQVGDQVYARPLKVRDGETDTEKPLENGNNSITGASVEEENDARSD